MLPESMLGETFLEKYADHNDLVTVIDHKQTYGVRAPTRHPIYENFRVKVSDPSFCSFAKLFHLSLYMNGLPS